MCNAEVQVLAEQTEIQCQTSDVQIHTTTSEDQSQSYDASSDYQRSAYAGPSSMRPKRMEIAVGDEGGTTQPAKIGGGALTTRAQQRVSFSFGVEDDSKHGTESEAPADREQLKREVTQSLSAAEERKQRAAERKRKIQEDYQKNRDPIKEFFTLTCQSVKINSPHMNLIALINSELLYAKALAEQVPYFKFASWIESTVQKEVIAQLFKSKMSSKSAIPKDLITGSEEQRKKEKLKQRTAKQKDQMKNQLIAFLNDKKQD